MNSGAVVFALANPDPEIDPSEAQAHAAVVATGRSGFPDQINNVLAFPRLFRGLLDAQATEITDGMLNAAARAIAEVISPDQLNASYIVPGVFDENLSKAVARAVVEAAPGRVHVDGGAKDSARLESVPPESARLESVPPELTRLEPVPPEATRREATLRKARLRKATLT